MSLYPTILAGLVGGVLTYVDLETVFDAPPHSLRRGPWLRLLSWWWGFVLANAILAGLTYLALRGNTPLKDLNPWLGAIAAGAGYTALVRLKLTTLSINGQDIPFGIEAFYEAVKSLVHRRINRIIREWRIEQSSTLAKEDLEELRRRALMMINTDGPCCTTLLQASFYGTPGEIVNLGVVFWCPMK